MGWFLWWAGVVLVTPHRAVEYLKRQLSCDVMKALTGTRASESAVPPADATSPSRYRAEPEETSHVLHRL
ncbi:hypothetical protein ACFFX0_01585 [Citricoccus parietis]|uniref:Uncharacterized protein n=1 Tax=Citricoccus parietis TaxID=592307 RepID=A0ABV5FTH1_9MICC